VSMYTKTRGNLLKNTLASVTMTRPRAQARGHALMLLSKKRNKKDQQKHGFIGTILLGRRTEIQAHSTCISQELPKIMGEKKKLSRL
jgi:hypothetical protein